MNPNLAMLTQNVIAGALFVFWLSAAAFVWLTFRKDQMEQGSAEQNATQTSELELNPGEHLRTAEEVVEGNSMELARRAAALLAQGQLLGSVRIKAEGADRVAFVSNGQHPVSRGLVEFRPLGSNRTNVTATFVKSKPSRALLWLAFGFCVVGLIALAGTYFLIDRFVVNAANPVIRWQVFQMFQAIHLMWEPFLFAGIYRSLKKMGDVAVDHAVAGLVHNLAFLPEGMVHGTAIGMADNSGRTGLY